MASGPGEEFDVEVIAGGGRRILRLVQFLAEVLKDVSGALKGVAGRRRPAQRRDLGAHVGFVAGEVSGQLRDLRRNYAAQGENDQERHQHHAHHRSGSWKVPILKKARQRGQNEAEKHGQRHREEHFAAKIERRHNQRCENSRCDSVHQLHGLVLGPCQSRCVDHQVSFPNGICCNRRRSGRLHRISPVSGRRRAVDIRRGLPVRRTSFEPPNGEMAASHLLKMLDKCVVYRRAAERPTTGRACAETFSVTITPKRDAT